MDSFKEFIFFWTYGYAESIRNVVLNDSNGLVDIEMFFSQEGKDFLDKSLKPNKKTLLQDFISESIYVETDYFLKKDFDSTIQEVYEVLDSYNAIYNQFDQYRGHDYRHYIMKKLDKYVLNRLSNEVFTLLYQDRELLRAFNEHAANYVRTLLYQHHPNYLARDGVFLRYNSWPKWLIKGLFFRDKGRCAICCCDLTGLYFTGHKLAIDHIVPLANGGINDPTNLQILCQKCNSTKGARSSHTKFWVPLYWEN